MPSALEEALAACETLLEEERLNGATETLIAAKEAAVTRLSDALAQAPSLDGIVTESLVARLKAVLTANRYSLKWSSLRTRLGQIGQPKPASQPSARPRIDLVH